MSDEPEGDWLAIGRFRSQAEADQHALVLVAVGIDCRLTPDARGVVLSVPWTAAARARCELAAYARENRQRRTVPLPRRRLQDGIDGVFAYGVLLLFLHGAARRETFGLDWLSAGVAQAGRILEGEWWRTLTALGLHADLGHLASNLAFGGVLGLLLTQSLGTGLAWLAILAGGALGNAVNALLRPESHAAIGASTAVFAALGLLAVLTLRDRAALWPAGLRRWLPLAAGAMLLAYMGTGGERTDIGAHVAGFVAGAGLGGALALAGGRVPQGRRAQQVYAGTTAGLLALAWLRALGSHG